MYNRGCRRGFAYIERRSFEAEITACLEIGGDEIFHQLLLWIDVMGTVSVQ
jgi:hypothetical protein